MKVSIRASALALAAAAVLVGPAQFATPAGAASPSVSCGKLYGAPLASKAQSYIATCTPAALKAGATSAFTAPPKGTQKGTLKGTYTWKNGKGKTIVLVKFAVQKTRGKRPAGTSRVTVTGSVTGGSGAAAKIVKVKEPLSASVCAVTSGPKAGLDTLEPGTKYKM